MIDYIFVAPEVLNNENLDERNDSYIFGCIVLFVLNGSVTGIKNLQEKLRGKMPKIPSNFNNFASDLVSRCLSNDSDERPTIDMILNEMEESHYKLMDLKTSEIEDVEKFVKTHKENISTYGK